MPLASLSENEFEFMMQSRQPLSEIMNMPYWKFEDFIERLNKRNEDISHERKKQEEQQNKAQSQYSSSALKAGPNMNNFKVPKFR
jgi:NH3-dependent NAD+ synthetase